MAARGRRVDRVGLETVGHRQLELVQRDISPAAYTVGLSKIRLEDDGSRRISDAALVVSEEVVGPCPCWQDIHVCTIELVGAVAVRESCLVLAFDNVEFAAGCIGDDVVRVEPERLRHIA